MQQPSDQPIVLPKTGVEPRPYQERIVIKTVQMLLGQYENGAGATERAARSVLIESPTGSGKTVMGHLVAKTLQHLFPDLVVGWVAMRRNLLSQASQENERLGINVGNISYVSMFEKEPAELVAARRSGKKVLLICDEAQHDAASSMTHLHNLIQPDWIVGLTATPFRTDSIKLVFDKIVRDTGIHQLIQDGYLSQFDYYSIQDWKPSNLAQLYCRDRERWGKSIFFMKNLEQCFQLNRIILEHGVSCDVVTGSSDRDTQLASFRSGEIDVLINCMVLTEGFDDPSLQSVFVRPSAKGPTIQMSGRALRKFEGLTCKNVIQSVDTKHAFTKTASPRQQYLLKDGLWRSLQVNPLLNLANQNVRRSIATTIITLPKFLTEKKSRGRRRFGDNSQN